MGLSGSRNNSRMSDSDHEESSSHRYNLRRRGRGSDAGDDEDDSDLSSIVAYLIRSGQIRFISQGGEDTDSDSSDQEVVSPSQAPASDLNPDTSDLKKSDMYAEVMKSSGRWSDKKWLTHFKPTVPNFMAKRELGLNAQKRFSHGDQCLINSKFLPNKMDCVCSYHHKAFCGTYSADGNVFLSACQDQYLRVYDTSNGEDFELIKSIRARDVGWSVLDTAFSPDGRYAAYSSWSDCIHLCNIFGDHEIHESLPLHPGDHSFCIFSLMFSSDNTEILGGANDGSIYVYDREINKRTLKIDAHDDDVNTVRFADNSSQILYSGGDDGLCKVWDRRTLREERPIPVGILAGHSDGITFIDSKGDARFFISNSKDQTLKLWDVRCCSDKSAVEETKRVVSSQRWDYRWQQVPRRMSKKKELKSDASVMTYRGHCILHTLIRCKFSPEAITGQRYIYTGCASGSVLVYDILTGQVARRLEGHSSCTRDVTWHPYRNSIVSTSWDGTLGHWYYYDYAAHGEEKPKTCEKKTRSLKNKLPIVKHKKEAEFPGLFD